MDTGSLRRTRTRLSSTMVLSPPAVSGKVVQLGRTLLAGGSQRILLAPDLGEREQPCLHTQDTGRLWHSRISELHLDRCFSTLSDQSPSLMRRRMATGSLPKHVHRGRELLTSWSGSSLTYSSLVPILAVTTKPSGLGDALLQFDKRLPQIQLQCGNTHWDTVRGTRDPPLRMLDDRWLLPLHSSVHPGPGFCTYMNGSSHPPINQGWVLQTNGLLHFRATSGSWSSPTVISKNSSQGPTEQCSLSVSCWGLSKDGLPSGTKQGKKAA